ncbi:hypothetical protein [Methylobacterium platani]|uniref:Uncharacterized protein n=2 Tax=Methylobacterium platani TaxID=427683 RepID=A0A179RXA6_9HYPH|nr:hypothetical protein SQ03_31140 [Methylobacterium platani JCM 14648]OAS13306.1 hypothetical protein A5481_31130 [Methylobacterium platani]
MNLADRISNVVDQVRFATSPARAGTTAEAAAVEIEALAKRRLADEYDAARKRGEVAQLGTN